VIRLRRSKELKVVKNKEDRMSQRFFLLALCCALIFSLGACKKKETAPAVPQTPGTVAPGPLMPPGQVQPGQMPPMQMPPGQVQPGQMPSGAQQRGLMMPRGKAHVVVPNSVKGKWSGAKIIVEDKLTKIKHEYTVKLGSDFKIPDTDLSIHVGDFLPDFRMDGLNLTSASNEPINPALAVRVFEKGKQIFPAPGREWGWLFGRVPSVHPFEHQKYGIILKEGVKKG
jgi:hypothetical protein